MAKMDCYPEHDGARHLQEIIAAGATLAGTWGTVCERQFDASGGTYYTGSHRIDYERRQHRDGRATWHYWTEDHVGVPAHLRY